MEVACPAIRETHFGDVAFVEDVRRLGIPLHALPLRRSIGLADVAAARSVVALLRRGRYDVVHTHSSKAGFIGRLAARLAGVPVVHTPNGLYFLEQTGLKRRFYLTLEQLAGRATTRMIAVSEGERDIIIRHGLASPERICLIENGVDVKKVRAWAGALSSDELRRSLNLSGEGALVGGVGRMAPQKDPLAFVRAARQVLRAIPDARFIWCGDGELRQSAEDLAHELNVPLRVTGHLENVWAVMQCFDVFVLPSLYEGLPFTLLEAMALGVRVVATDVVGTRDVLQGEGAGWLVASRDETALAAAVVDALTRQAEAQKRVEAASRLVETRFSIERMISAHGELYEAVMRSEGRR
jgi:glycosyltransferase involved in cell wall biosynthesis